MLRLVLWSLLGLAARELNFLQRWILSPLAVTGLYNWLVAGVRLSFIRFPLLLTVRLLVVLLPLPVALDDSGQHVWLRCAAWGQILISGGASALAGLPSISSICIDKGYMARQESGCCDSLCDDSHPASGRELAWL